jgi:hypothetical protein
MLYSERYGFIHIGKADTAAALFQGTENPVPWFATKNRLAGLKPNDRVTEATSASGR